MLHVEPDRRETHVTLGAFRVGDTVYALDVAHLREVVRPQPPTPLPRSPQLIEGVIDLRGRVVPVVDLGRALGGAPVPEGPAVRIAIAEIDGLVLGLRVAEALEVIRVEHGRFEDPPALATQAGCDAARAIVRRPDAAPVMVLSLESVLEQVYRSGIAAGEGGA